MSFPSKGLHNLFCFVYEISNFLYSLFISMRDLVLSVRRRFFVCLVLKNLIPFERECNGPNRYHVSLCYTVQSSWRSYRNTVFSIDKDVLQSTFSQAKELKLICMGCETLVTSVNKNCICNSEMWKKLSCRFASENVHTRSFCFYNVSNHSHGFQNG